MTVVLLLLDTVVLLQVQVVLLSLVIVPSLDTVFDEEDCEELVFVLVEELPGAGTLGKTSPKTSLLFLLHEQVSGFAVVPAPNVVNFVALVGGAAFVVESVVVKSVVVESVVVAAIVVLGIVVAAFADDVVE